MSIDSCMGQLQIHDFLFYESLEYYIMPCPFTGPKCFVRVQSFWASPKIWLHLVPLQKLLCWHKNQFYWIQIIFLSGTKCLWLPQYVNDFLVRHKKFGPAQNILGHVKGQGINNFKKVGRFFQTFGFLTISELCSKNCKKMDNFCHLCLIHQLVLFEFNIIDHGKICKFIR